MSEHESVFRGRDFHGRRGRRRRCWLGGCRWGRERGEVMRLLAMCVCTCICICMCSRACLFCSVIVSLSACYIYLQRKRVNPASRTRATDLRVLHLHSTYNVFGINALCKILKCSSGKRRNRECGLQVSSRGLTTQSMDFATIFLSNHHDNGHEWYSI